MARVEFTHYLHDDYGKYELVDAIEKQTGLNFTEEQMENLGRPFYEVTLHCVLDTDTMGVKILWTE